MSSLLDLPPELLAKVLEEVGGRELRRGKRAEGLLICRAWYAAARPVYLSGLGTSKVNIYGHNLHELGSKFASTGLRPLMYKNTRSLRIRLLGHWWDEATAQGCEDQDDDGDDAADSPGRNDPSCDFTTSDGERQLELWRDDLLRPRLDNLFQDLSNFEVLESFTFEASLDHDPDDGPRWDYIHAATIHHLLVNLPLGTGNLSSLTIDLCGSGLLLPDTTDTHLCKILASIIPRVRNVRLRLRNICPAIFQLPSDITPKQCTLGSLVVKLHHPWTPESTRCWTEPCPSDSSPRYDSGFLHAFARAAEAYRRNIDRLLDQPPVQSRMSTFRISLVALAYPSVYTLDVLSMRFLHLSEEFFAYEDEGMPCWFEVGEDAQRLEDGGPFEHDSPDAYLGWHSRWPE